MAKESNIVELVQDLQFIELHPPEMGPLGQLVLASGIVRKRRIYIVVHLGPKLEGYSQHVTLSEEEARERFRTEKASVFTEG